MNFSQDEGITGLDEMQTYDFNPEFDLETSFLTMADDLNAMSSGDIGAFDPTQMVGDTSYMTDSSATSSVG